MRCPVCNRNAEMKSASYKGAVTKRNYYCYKCSQAFETQEKMDYSKLSKKALEALHDRKEAEEAVARYKKQRGEKDRGKVVTI